jgi:hypothetical protein
VVAQARQAGGDLTSVELHQHLASFGTDRADEAKVAVVDSLVVAILDLPEQKVQPKRRMQA